MKGDSNSKKSRKSKHKPNLEMPAGAPIFKKLKADEVVADDDESITEVRVAVWWDDSYGSTNRCMYFHWVGGGVDCHMTSRDVGSRSVVRKTRHCSVFVVW